MQKNRVKGGDAMSFLSRVLSYLISPYKIDFKQETGSTSDDVSACAPFYDEFYVIVSNSQTKGKGRKSRSFFSPPGCGLYFSILLKPTMAPDKAVFITAAAAVAVCDAIELVSDKTPEIKWVNDVFVDGKKVCGILTEGSVENGRLRHAVLGIGINLTVPHNGYPHGLENVIGAVFDTLDDEAKARFFAAVLDRFYHYYTNGGYLQRYKDLCFVLGRDITVTNGDFHAEATALDIDDDCRLIVRYADGHTEALNSGEISVLL